MCHLGDGPDGVWSKSKCPEHTGITGISVRYEEDGKWDHTGLNDVRFKCGKR